MEYVMHTREDAPDTARAGLERVEAKYGFVPNLAATMAQEPGLLHAYLEAEQAFRDSALSPQEQEVVALTVSFHNGCRYCMSAHSMLASMAGLAEADLTALRSGTALPTPRLEALRSLTLALMGVGETGADAAIEAFLDAGFDRHAALAVPLGVAFKTLSNLTHHIQPVPVDEPMQDFLWEPVGPEARVLITGWLADGRADDLAQYQAAAGPIMKEHGARLLMKGRPETAFAGARPDLVILLAFPTSEAARAAFENDDYRSLIPVRNRAFERLDVVGLEDPPRG